MRFQRRSPQQFMVIEVLRLPFLATDLQSSRTQISSFRFNDQQKQSTIIYSATATIMCEKTDDAQKE